MSDRSWGLCLYFAKFSSGETWLQVKLYFLLGDIEIISANFASGLLCYSRKYSKYILHCCLSQVDRGNCAAFVSIGYYYSGQSLTCMCVGVYFL